MIYCQLQKTLILLVPKYSKTDLQNLELVRCASHNFRTSGSIPTPYTITEWVSPWVNNSFLCRSDWTPLCPTSLLMTSGNISWRWIEHHWDTQIGWSTTQQSYSLHWINSMCQLWENPNPPSDCSVATENLPLGLLTQSLPTSLHIVGPFRTPPFIWHQLQWGWI